MVASKQNKIGSAASVISNKRSVADSENSMVKPNNGVILEPLEQAKEKRMIDKIKSQDSLVTDSNSQQMLPYKNPQYTPEKLKDRESRISSDKNAKDNIKSNHNIKNPK